MITIYTDGSCSPNPGPGGWGAIVILPDCELWFSGRAEDTTNNLMELTAVIEGIKETAFSLEPLTIYTDSLYVINCAKGIWQRKKNSELWKEYDRVSKGRQITFRWVKGHSGDHYNEAVDKLARFG